MWSDLFPELRHPVRRSILDVDDAHALALCCRDEWRMREKRRRLPPCLVVVRKPWDILCALYDLHPEEVNRRLLYTMLDWKDSSRLVVNARDTVCGSLTAILPECACLWLVRHLDPNGKTCRLWIWPGLEGLGETRDARLERVTFIREGCVAWRELAKKPSCVSHTHLDECSVRV
jgi:hypothetical protein